MFHHKASVQVEYRYVPLVPVKPCPVLWKADVYQLEDKLQRHKQAERERQEFMLLGHSNNPGGRMDVWGKKQVSHSVSERIQSFCSFIT